MENRQTAKKKFSYVFLILLTGLICPFAARIPGSLLYGIDFLLAYTPSAAAVLFICVFNIIPFAVLALVVKVKYDSNKPAVMGAGITVYGVDLLGHGALDLSSSSTAGIAIVFIPLWITLLIPVGYLMGVLAGKLWKFSMGANTQ